jgi:CheY-like chemotaxis protein
MADFAKLVSAFAELVWPCVLIYAIWKFGAAVKDLIANFSEGSIKGFGIEASAKRLAAEAINTAETKGPPTVPPEEGKPPVLVNIPAGAGKSRALTDFVVNAVPLKQLRGKRILWVDDKPENNDSERLALTALGLVVVDVRSTDEALRRLQKESFDVVISDMKRGDDEFAGYKLIDAMKADLSTTPPVIFYSTSPLNNDEVQKKGAFGFTNSAVDLVILLADALRASGKLDLGENFGRRIRELRNWIVHRIPG